MWRLNTSNEGKLKEYQQLFAKYGLELLSTTLDLKEIDADPLKVVIHKASQVQEQILIEDTTLEVEDASIGVNVRWLLEHLPQYVGRKAVWKTLLAYHRDNNVYVFEGIVHGTIVAPRGTNGFGFDSVFLPTGASETLAESKPDHVNARVMAVKALLNNQPCAIESVMDSWEGPWQNQV